MEPSNTPLCIWKVPFFGTGSHWVVFHLAWQSEQSHNMTNVEATSRQRRGNVEATCLSYDIRRLRLRTYGGGCDGGGSFVLGPSDPHGSLMATVMLSCCHGDSRRFTAIHGVRHWTWIKNSQEVKHVEAYPATLPTARGSAERVREDIAIRGKKWCEQTARSREREADKRSSSFSSMGRRCGEPS